MPLTTLCATKTFQTADWVVLGGYFALIALTGWWFSRRKTSGTHDYFLANRSMPVWAVSISVLATATSAATFIGAPEEAYKGDLTYLSTTIGGLLSIALVAMFFIPAFYRHNVTTVYDLLKIRYGESSRLAASWAFLVGRVFASGSRLFMAAIPLSLILFRDVAHHHLLGAIAVLVAAGVLYTLAGGIRSIIWTDVIQTSVFVGAAAIALSMLVSRIPLGLPEMIDVLRATPSPVGEGSKLTVIRTGLGGTGFDLSNTYTLLTAVTGFMLLGVGSYGTDHDLAQRMLTCRSAARGSMSAVIAILISLPVVAIFMSIGLLLYIFYQRPDIMGDASPGLPPTKGREIFLSFILNEMPSGMSGLMMAGLFAAGLGSFNSALNAMAAAFINDVYRRARPEKSERHYLAAGRWAVAGWGLILGVFAGICVYWQAASGQTLIKFALSVMSFAYAGLVGVYFAALFTKRGNNTSVIAALLVGFDIVLWMQGNVWEVWTDFTPWTRTHLRPLFIAFPWQLTIGATAAFLVCISGMKSRAASTSDGVQAAQTG